MLTSNKYYLQKSLAICLVVLFFATACTSTSTLQPSSHLLSDTHFPGHKTYAVESPSEIFKLEPMAIEFVEQVTAGKYTEKQQITALVGAIFDRANLSLNYLSQANYTANQSFENRTANCLSLTIMVYSMSQYLGLQSEFKEINVPEFWTRRDGNTLLNGHINIQVQPKNSFRNQISKARPMIIDFDPLQQNRKFKSYTLQREQVVSLFYTNKAADAMIDENNDLAFAYLKEAIKTDKRNTGAWLNLGVLFSRNNMMKEAESAYLHVKDINSKNSTALENLASLYRKTNRKTQASLIEKRLDSKRRTNPYYHTMLGDVAFDEKNYDSAIRHYKQAISLNHKPHEFYYNLAKVYFAIGDIRNTKRYLQNAKQRAKDDEQEEVYKSKLSLLASRQQAQVMSL